MASPFAEALMSSMTAQLDPMNNLVHKMGETMFENQDVNTVRNKLGLISEIEKVLDSVSDSTRPAVTNAYEKLLSRITS